jgi:hypothetical protein
MSTNKKFVPKYTSTEPYFNTRPSFFFLCLLCVCNLKYVNIERDHHFLKLRFSTKRLIQHSFDRTNRKKRKSLLGEKGKKKTGGHDIGAPSWIQVLQQQQVRRKAFHIDCSLFQVRSECDKGKYGALESTGRI